MRYLVLLTFSALCLLFACTKDNAPASADLQNGAVDSRSAQKVTVCHVTGNGSYHAIEINVNALPAHLAHGDYLPDADGDGYSAVGACTGSMNDCDDNNPDVNPGAAEICGNGIDDNCDGNIDEGCTSNPCFSAESFEGVTFNHYYDSEVNDCQSIPYNEIVTINANEIEAFVFETTSGTKGIVTFTSEGDCVAIVGVDITEEDWQAAMDLLRQVIAENSIPNFCGDCVACLPGTEERATFKTRLESLKTKMHSTVKTQ